MEHELLTIGYEGANLDAFVRKLLESGVACLIDVREIPLSRKPGFSKSRLAQRLARDGIEYVHLRQLGSPKPLREKFKNDHNFPSFHQAMLRHLETNIEGIQAAYAQVSTRRCCLMCYEKSPQQCHRTAVALKIKQFDGNGLRISNVCIS